MNGIKKPVKWLLAGIFVIILWICAGIMYAPAPRIRMLPPFQGKGGSMTFIYPRAGMFSLGFSLQDGSDIATFCCNINLSSNEHVFYHAIIRSNDLYKANWLSHGDKVTYFLPLDKVVKLNAGKQYFLSLIPVNVKSNNYDFCISYITTIGNSFLYPFKIISYGEPSD